MHPSAKSVSPDDQLNHRKLCFIRFVIENIIGYDAELLRPILKQMKLNPQGIESANKYADALRRNASLSGVECEFRAQLRVLLNASGVDYEKTDFESILKQIDDILLTRRRTILWPFDNTLNGILKEMKPAASREMRLSDEEMTQLLRKQPYQGVYQYDIWTLGPFGLIESRSPRYFIPISKEDKESETGIYWIRYKFYGCPSPGHCSDIKKIKEVKLEEVSLEKKEKETPRGFIALPAPSRFSDTPFREEELNAEDTSLDVAVDRIGCYSGMISFLGHELASADLAKVLFKVFKQNESFYRGKFFDERNRFNKVIAGDNIEKNFFKCSKPELLQLFCLVGYEDIVKAIDTMIFDGEWPQNVFVVSQEITSYCEVEIGTTLVPELYPDSENELVIFPAEKTSKLGIGPYGMTKVRAGGLYPPQLLLTHLIIKAFKSAGQEEDLTPFTKKYGSKTLEEGMLSWILEKSGKDVVDHMMASRHKVLKETLYILKMPEPILDKIDFQNEEDIDKLINWILNKVGLYPPPKIDDGLNNYERLISKTIEYVEDKGLKKLDAELKSKLLEIFNLSEKILKDTIIFNSYMFPYADDFLFDFVQPQMFFKFHEELLRFGCLLAIPEEEAVMLIKESFDGQPIGGEDLKGLKIDKDIEKWDLGTAYHIIELFPGIIQQLEKDTMLGQFDSTRNGFLSEQAGAFRDFNRLLQNTKLKDIRNSMSHHRDRSPKLGEIYEMLENLRELAEFMRESGLYPRLAHYKGARTDAHGLTRLTFKDEYGDSFEAMWRGDYSLFNPFEVYGFKTFAETEPFINYIIIKKRPVLRINL